MFRGRNIVKNSMEMIARVNRRLSVASSIVFLSFVRLDFSSWLAGFNSSTEDRYKEDLRMIVYEAIPKYCQKRCKTCYRGQQTKIAAENITMRNTWEQYPLLFTSKSIINTCGNCK